MFAHGDFEHRAVKFRILAGVSGKLRAAGPRVSAFGQ